jgi:hypothetical protein
MPRSFAKVDGLPGALPGGRDEYSAAIDFSSGGNNAAAASV